MTMEVFQTDDMVPQGAFRAYCAEKERVLDTIDGGSYHSSMLGWQDLERNAGPEPRGRIGELAAEIRARADYLVVVGLGGSNQGARAVIDALGGGRSGTKILYAALNLSARSLQDILDTVEGGSVYINVIAKNFKTLEPGVTFRVLRDYMERRYGKEEAARRTVTTLTVGDGELHALSASMGYRYLEFPADVGGRYSVFTAVGLLPCAVAGVDIEALVRGARDMRDEIARQGPAWKQARQYALTRNFLLEMGYDIEVLAFFEPALESLGRWWRQLFGESEGKNGTGIFPAVCSYTEDLHSMGQYMQQGKRQVMETFLRVARPEHDLPIPPNAGAPDGFDYLDGLSLAQLNESAYRATVEAHFEGGVPCFALELPELSPQHVGGLLYFFMQACFYSAAALGVDPFDQPGVENYKTKMMELLKG